MLTYLLCEHCGAPSTITRERYDEIGGGLRRYYACPNQHRWQTIEVVVDQSRVDRAQLARMLRQQREQLDHIAEVLGVEA